jgi:hypothetical protein
MPSRSVVWPLFECQVPTGFFYMWPTSTVLDAVAADSEVDSSFGDVRRRGTDAARTSRPQKRHRCHDDRLSHGSDGRVAARRRRRSGLLPDGVDESSENEMRIENQKATNNRRRQAAARPRGMMGVERGPECCRAFDRKPGLERNGRPMTVAHVVSPRV